jgi:hypothetical protein
MYSVWNFMKEISLKNLKYQQVRRSQDSSFSRPILTKLWAGEQGNRGSILDGRRCFSAASSPALAPSQPPIKLPQGTFNIVVFNLAQRQTDLYILVGSSWRKIRSGLQALTACRNCAAGHVNVEFAIDPKQT